MTKFLESFATGVWEPLLFLLVGGGIFFMLYSRFVPFRYFGHALNLIRGKYNNPDDPGDINHFQALAGALAATVGMGNIAGVAVAIAAGGPGAIFWMWVSAFFGIATKYFTCTLAVMYRGRDSQGQLQGGPMYFITEGLGKKWRPLAIAFAVFGFFGATPLFQTNQMVQALQDIIFIPLSIGEDATAWVNLSVGVAIAIATGTVIFGGITRIGTVAARLVPGMVLLYLLCVAALLTINYEHILPSLGLIFSDAFSGKAVLDGTLGSMIVTGVRRAAFSNEAGIGTAPMMHGAAKTSEPVREGLVAMMGPAIDTLLVCSLTAASILVTGVWKKTDASGITLTAEAFEQSLPGIGPYALAITVLVFGFTTIIGLAYYGRKCLAFLIGAEYSHFFNYWYLLLILLGSLGSLEWVVAIVDIGYGLMAFPNMIGALLLAPRVMAATKSYFSKQKGL